MGTQGTVGQDLFETKNRSVRKTGGKASTCTKVQVLQNETGREADRWKLNNLTDSKKAVRLPLQPHILYILCG